MPDHTATSREQGGPQRTYWAQAVAAAASPDSQQRPMEVSSVVVVHITPCYQPMAAALSQPPCSTHQPRGEAWIHSMHSICGSGGSLHGLHQGFTAVQNKNRRNGLYDT